MRKLLILPGLRKTLTNCVHGCLQQRCRQHWGYHNSSLGTYSYQSILKRQDKRVGLSIVLHTFTIQCSWLFLHNKIVLWISLVTTKRFNIPIIRSKSVFGLVPILTLKVLVATIDAQWEGMGDVGLARNEPALLPPCPTIRVLSYSN